MRLLAVTNLLRWSEGTLICHLYGSANLCRPVLVIVVCRSEIAEGGGSLKLRLQNPRSSSFHHAGVSRLPFACRRWVVLRRLGHAHAVTRMRETHDIEMAQRSARPSTCTGTVYILRMSVSGQLSSECKGQI